MTLKQLNLVCTNAAWTFGRFFPAKTFFAAGCIFPDYATAVIFYPVIKTMKIFVHIIWVLPHLDIIFEDKTQLQKYAENCPKIGSNSEFTRFSIIF